MIVGGLLPAAEAQTPGRLPPSAGEAARIERAAPQSHLKWRPSTKVKAVQKQDSEIRPVAHVQLAPADGHPLAQHSSTLPPADPFNDPFGDEITKYTSQQETQAPSRFSQPQPMPPAEEEPMLDAPPQPPAVEPAPRQSAPPATEQLPPRFGIDPQFPDASNPDCEQIYKDRNCCDEADNCRIIRQDLARVDIRNINLDISPAFSPDEEDPAQAQALQSEAMQQTPIRPWRNLEGQVVAEGRLMGVRNQRVLIDTGSDIQELALRQLGSDEQCFLAAYWNVPYECGWTDQPFVPRNWAPLEVNWTASALCHKPLYFEERALERYGHMTGPISQPLLSGAHFFGSVALLPYKMGLNPPTECMYSLGYYRPGNCAPHLIPPVPLSARAAAAQSAAVLGVVYWIP